MSAAQVDFFGGPALPEGMRYEREFLTREEETELIALIHEMPLHEMQYKAFTAKRRVISFGGQYDFQAQRLEEAA